MSDGVGTLRDKDVVVDTVTDVETGENEPVKSYMERFKITPEDSKNFTTDLHQITLHKLTQMLEEFIADENIKAIMNIVCMYPQLVNIKQNDSGMTPFLCAVKSSDEKAIAMLLKLGADINQMTNDGQFAELLTDSDDILNFLIDSGMDVNLKGYCLMSPLMLEATVAIEWSVPQNLIKHGAIVNDANCKENTALHIAAKYFEGGQSTVSDLDQIASTVSNLDPIESQSLPFIRQLIAAGADLTLINEDGNTPLLMAVRHSVELHSEYNELETDPDESDEPDRSHIKSRQVRIHKSHSVIKVLLESGSNINHQNKKGNTALMLAVKERNVHLIEYLIEKGAHVNTQNAKGETALMIAAKSKSVDSVKCFRLLLEKGADPNVMDTHGCTAAIRVIVGDLDITRLNSDVQFAKTPQFEDTCCGMLSLLVSSGFTGSYLQGYATNTDDKDPNLCAYPPLHIAAMCKFPKIIQLILDLGVDQFIQDENSNTPFDCCWGNLCCEDVFRVEATGLPKNIKQLVLKVLRLSRIEDALSPNEFKLTTHIHCNAVIALNGFIQTNLKTKVGNTLLQNGCNLWKQIWMAHQLIFYSELCGNENERALVFAEKLFDYSVTQHRLNVFLQGYSSDTSDDSEIIEYTRVLRNKTKNPRLERLTNF